MNEKLLEEWQIMIQIRIESDLREFIKLIEESPDEYFGIGIYEDEK